MQKNWRELDAKFRFRQYGKRKRNDIKSKSPALLFVSLGTIAAAQYTIIDVDQTYMSDSPR